MDILTLDRANKIRKQILKIEDALEDITEFDNEKDLEDKIVLVLSKFSDGSGRICFLTSCGIAEDVLKNVIDLLNKRKDELNEEFKSL